MTVVDALAVILVTVTGGSTVMTTDADRPPELTVRVTVPTATPTTVPDGSIVAIDESLELQPLAGPVVPLL
jgi:hypothetical protein